MSLIVCTIIVLLGACGPNLSNQNAVSGFDPGVHGFSFKNYTNRGAVVNLGAAEMQRMFGDQVCARFDNEVCWLTPPALHWMEQVNSAMNGGHCEGMAVLSNLMFYGEIDPTEFGGDNTHELVLEGNPALQREIAYWWVTQVTYPGASVKVNGSPSLVVETLQEAFSQSNDVEEAWALGIYQPDMSAGHSITPAAVVDQGDGIYHILVYDNNFPDDLRPIIVDVNQETWEYEGMANPDGSPSIYRGDAATRTLEAVAISPRLEQQACSFCQGSDQSWLRQSVSGDVAGDFYEIWLEGEADLLIRDREGRRLGYADGEMVNEIPGARVSWLRTQSESGPIELTPHYFVPVELSLDFRVDGSRLDSPGYSSFSIIGPAGYLSIEELWVQPGESQEVSVWVDGSRYQVIYWHNEIETPVVEIGYEASDANYFIRVQATELVTEDDELDVILDLDSGEFIISTDFNIAPAAYSLYLKRVDLDGEYAFGVPEFVLDPNTTVTLVYGKWEGGDQGMRALIDDGSDGIADEEVELPNQIGDYEW